MFPCYQRCLLPASLGFALASCGGPDVPVLVFAVRSVNELHPRRVERYEELLRRQRTVHRALGRRLQSAKAEPITPEELRALGYVR